MSCASDNFQGAARHRRLDLELFPDQAANRRFTRSRYRDLTALLPREVQPPARSSPPTVSRQGLQIGHSSIREPTVPPSGRARWLRSFLLSERRTVRMT